MSDLAPHARDDLPYYPEPRHTCNCSPALCEVCSPRRSLSDALKLPAYRDLPADYLGPRAEVVVLAECRPLVRGVGRTL